MDVEVYNAAGARVGQQFWSGQSLRSGQSRRYTYAWTAPNAAGACKLKVGVFDSTWATLYHWNDSAGRVTVTTGR